MYTPPGLGAGQLLVHPDGTVFVPYTVNGAQYVAGIDPTTAATKFTVQWFGPQTQNDHPSGSLSMLIAGYAYYPYWDSRSTGSGWVTHQMLMRVNSSGASDQIDIASWPGLAPDSCYQCVGNITTNGDQGVLLTWTDEIGESGMAVTNGTAVSVAPGPKEPGQPDPNLPDQTGMAFNGILQMQDGSFVGAGLMGARWDMIAFDHSGNVRWVVQNEQPYMATADGGVIGQSGITYDVNGNATGQMQLPTQSWLGNTYEIGSVDQILFAGVNPALSFWPFLAANASQSSTAVSQPQFPPLAICTTTPGCLGPRDAIYNALADLIARLMNPAVIPGISPPTTLSGLAQSQIFAKLGNDANGNPLTTASFVRYLTQMRPALYDGTKSAFCYSSLTPYSTPCWLPILGSSQTVAQYLANANNADVSAVSATPNTQKMVTFFRPSWILFPSAGDNLGNESTIFHEALHGLTGQSDFSILSNFGYDSFNSPICQISVYISSSVLSYSPGIDTAQNCN